MDVSLVRMPWSKYVGGAAIAVTVMNDDKTEEVLGAMIRRVSKLLTFGTACIWLRDVPWAEPWWEQAAFLIQRIRKRQEIGVPVLATHRPDDAEWIAGDLYWVLDPSELFAEETSPAVLAERLGAMPMIPPVEELVLRNPHPANITPQMLDAIAYYAMPQSRPSQLVLPPAVLEEYLATSNEDGPGLVKVLARCETPWAVVPG